MPRTLCENLLVLALLVVAAKGKPANHKRIAAAEPDFLINPDVALGRTFHVNAKQWDGTKRCYFIVVGKKVEQGPVNKRSNKDCEKSYAFEFNLGHYSRTTVGSIPRQEYTGGDTQYCGKAGKRKSTLTMVKRDQHDITAYVREPERCMYEVTLHGSVFLLTGSSGDPLLTGGSGEPLLTATARRAAPTRSPSAVSQSGKRKQSSKHSKTKPPSHWERAKHKAAEVVRSTSRDALLAKPARALQELMRDLGVSCKSCLEKSQLVDKLQTVGGVRSEL